MQLFIVEYASLHIENQRLHLSDERVCAQLSRVLRAKPGYVCTIQSTKDAQTFRREITIEALTPKYMEATISSMQHKETSSTTAFLVPLPNKREKLELILQKLTEIGVDEIILRPAERSQLKTIPEQKRSRWQTIITEAAEQSWRWSIPEVRYIKDCTALDNQSGTKSSTKYVYKVFDISRTDSEKETSQKNILEAFPADSISKVTCGLIGPEGGLSERDYAAFPLPYEVISLGETVLRMETAAIIGGRKIVAERK